MNEIISRTENYVRSVLQNEATGHDWYHIERVWKNALLIHKQERAGDLFVIEMAALLHDIPDGKLNPSEEEGWKKLNQYINTLELPDSMVTHILECIESVSYKGGRVTNLKTIEAKIVQDADRLDAIGAIGIARTFAFGGKKAQPLYDPEIAVRGEMTTEEYRHGKSSSVHHFYEKLLKLRELMNTSAARQLAEQRHEFMEDFLNQFYREWNGQA